MVCSGRSRKQDVSSQEVSVWAEAVSQVVDKRFDSFMSKANYTRCEYDSLRLFQAVE